MQDVIGNHINKNNFEEDGRKQWIFCDPVHGQISFDSLCLKIIDTPEFQRLRFIKQLGFLYTVYPGADNNRFEHSLGVAYLSRKFLLELRNNQPELCITNEEIICVQIAGLCHDLGHGPFSHSWERFMQESRAKRKDENKAWKHEKVSIRMFDYLVQKYNLREEFKKFNMDETYINFIRDLIMGRCTNDKRTFLFQIVNNDESGLDVDKWDYYLRDCLFLGIKCGFEYKRLMQFARVINIDGKNTICFRDKVVHTVYGNFRTRSELHHVAYQHRMNRRIETIINDALIEADGRVQAPNGEIFQFYNWSNDVINDGKDIESTISNFCMMTDNAVYNALKYCKIEKVKNIIKLVERRFQDSRMYQTVSSCWNVTEEPDENTVKNEIIKCGNELSSEERSDFYNKYKTEFNLNENDFDIQIIPIHWGKGEDNPVNHVYFYSKDNMNTAFKWKQEETNWMEPKSFRNIRLSILCKKDDDITYETLKICWEKYRTKNN